MDKEIKTIIYKARKESIDSNSNENNNQVKYSYNPFVYIKLFLKTIFKFFKGKISLVVNLIKLLKLNFELYINQKERRFQLKVLMENSNSYDEWKHYASELDELDGKFKWKSKKETSLYNYQAVEKLIVKLSFKRESKDIKGLMHVIRSNLMRNLYNINNPLLYEISNTGTKLQIEILNDEISKSLEYICNNIDLTLDQKIDFFSEVRHSYGKTALLLSGGASLGMYHTGVIKTLLENNLLPKIICGSSAGSIVAALVCTSRYEDVHRIIDRGLKLGPFEYKDKKYSWLRKLVRFILRGVLFDGEVLKEFLRENLGDFTFQEAYDRTGWILNVTVTAYKQHENSRVLNYLSAPNVLIWSAVAASCSVPTLFDPTELFCKNENGVIVPYSYFNEKFIDGSISFDLPVIRISELFNTNNFIVSQTNPYVIPFLSNNSSTNTNHEGIYNQEKGKFNLWKLLKSLIFSEIKHRLSQLQEIGILPEAINKMINLVTQTYHGNVTIFPVPSPKDYLKSVTNPSKEMIANCSIHSSRRTFPQINKIEGLLKTEILLEKLYFKLKYKQRKLHFNADNKTYLNEKDNHKSKSERIALTNTNNELFESIDDNHNKIMFGNINALQNAMQINNNNNSTYMNNHYIQCNNNNKNAYNKTNNDYFISEEKEILNSENGALFNKKKKTMNSKDSNTISTSNTNNNKAYNHHNHKNSYAPYKNDEYFGNLHGNSNNRRRKSTSRKKRNKYYNTQNKSKSRNHMNINERAHSMSSKGTFNNHKNKLNVKLSIIGEESKNGNSYTTNTKSCLISNTNNTNTNRNIGHNNNEFNDVKDNNDNNYIEYDINSNYRNSTLSNRNSNLFSENNKKSDNNPFSCSHSFKLDTSVNNLINNNNTSVYSKTQISSLSNKREFVEDSSDIKEMINENKRLSNKFNSNYIKDVTLRRESFTNVPRSDRVEEI